MDQLISPVVTGFVVQLVNMKIPLRKVVKPDLRPVRRQ
jgi:hypothetical protein